MHMFGFGGDEFIDEPEGNDTLDKEFKFESITIIVREQDLILKHVNQMIDVFIQKRKDAEKALGDATNK